MDRQLRAMCEQNRSWDNITVRLGLCGIEGVVARARRLGIHKGFAPHPKGWSDKDIDTLRRMWADGATTLQIAAAIGRRKNCVIGKAHRLGLPPRPSPIKISAGAKSAPKKQARPKVKRPKAARAPIVAMPPRAPEVKCTLISSAQTCQFPLWDNVVRAPRPPLFCDESATHGSWCAKHYAICFTRGASA